MNEQLERITNKRSSFAQLYKENGIIPYCRKSTALVAALMIVSHFASSPSSLSQQRLCMRSSPHAGTYTMLS